MTECLMKKDLLEEILRNTFNKDYKVIAITRLLGGAQKGTYKVECDQGLKLVLYIWDDALSYFEAQHTAEEFTSSSAYLFKANYELMVKHNISVPKLYHIDLSKSKAPFEYALVEYIDGGELEERLYNPKIDCSNSLLDLKQNLQKLHSITSKQVGDLKYTRDESFSCKDYVKASLEQSLKYLIDNYEPITKLKEPLIDISQKLYEEIEERKSYHLIHFELGPNHVMVDRQGKTYLIDFEGMKYFDLEYEYSFLKLRFGKYYPELISLPIDEKRLKYYLLGHHLNALNGAHHLLMQNYYDMDDVNQMLKSNYQAIVENYLNCS